MLEKTLKSPLDCKEIQPVHPKGNQSWLFTGKTDAEVEIPILWSPDAKNWTFHWKRPWCWERFKAGGERVDRGWDGWMASPTQWTWVWVNSGNWWGTGRPGVLQFMGSQRVGHDWATELNWDNVCVKINKRKKPQLTLHLGRPGEATLMPYHSLSFADPNKKKCNLHIRPEVTLLYYPSGWRNLAQQPVQPTEKSTAQ